MSKERKQFNELTPQEVLSLAIAIEALNAHRYTEWADRFKPFDDEASRLLEELSEEEVMHQHKLEVLYHQQFGKKITPVSTEEINARIEQPHIPGEHFFVVDENMAHKILWAALKTELKARHFYETALETTTAPALKKMYHWLATFEEDHIQVLQNRLQALKKIKHHEYQHAKAPD